ncbi:MAG: LEPR-XLL domain-containing protein, partial [Rubripirellula sp.]
MRRTRRSSLADRSGQVVAIRREVRWSVNVLEPRLMLAADAGVACVVAVEATAGDCSPAPDVIDRNPVATAASVVFLDQRAPDLEMVAASI